MARETWITQDVPRGSVAVLSSLGAEDDVPRAGTINSIRMGRMWREERVAEPPVPIPEKEMLTRSAAGPDEAYLALATKLGIRSAAVLEAQLEAVIHELRLPIYDSAKVHAYLESECRKLQKEGGPYVRVAWKPVRPQDAPTDGLVRNHWDLYQKAIPYPVLCTMDAIATRMPEARFVCSEIEAHPDPFLGVTVEGSEKLWIVERWDEPGFRS